MREAGPSARRPFQLEKGGRQRKLGISAGAVAVAVEPRPAQGAAQGGERGTRVWLSEGCGGRIKCMRVGGADGGAKCVATLRNLPGAYGTPNPSP